MPNAQIENIRVMLKQNPVIVEGASLESMRQGLDAMGNMAPRLPDVSSSAVDAGGVKAEWFTPAGGDPSRVLLYLHGGGYVLGSIDSHRVLIERLAKAIQGR